MRKTSTLLVSVLSAAVALATAPAMAQSKGDWTLGVGVHAVDPTSDAGDLDGAALGLGRLPTNVDSDAKPTLTFEYFVADNVGIEVLAALPFKHEIASTASVRSAKPASCRRWSRCSTTSPTAAKSPRSSAWA